MAAPRVELRKLRDEDKVRLLAWRNSPHVAAYMYSDHQITAAEHELWFAAIEGDARRAYWIIETDGAPVGLANLYDIDPKNRRCAWAYYLAEPSVRGRGVGGQAEYLVIEKAFGEFGLTKLWCEVLASNEAVIRLHKKFGFQQEARFRRHVLKNGVMEDVVGLGLLIEDWAEIRPRLRRTLDAAGSASG